MVVEQIARSAVSLANTALSPNAIDRKVTMPVAAMVILNASTGQLALRGHGHALPTTGEIPALPSEGATEFFVAEALEYTLDPVENAGFTVESVVGLPARFTKRQEALEAAWTLDGRRLAVLPFLVTVHGQNPSTRPFGMFWAHRQIALDHIRQDRDSWPAVGITMMRRVFSGTHQGSGLYK